jgi:hypothetical protein
MATLLVPSQGLQFLIEGKMIHSEILDMSVVDRHPEFHISVPGMWQYIFPPSS